MKPDLSQFFVNFNPRNLKNCAIAGLIPLLANCSTTGSNTEENLFRVQKRLLELERKVNDEVLGKQKQEGARRLARGEEKAEALNTDVMMLRGEVDALRMGVTLGEMPGTPQGTETLAKTVQQLAARLHTLETRQIEMLELLDKTKAKNLAKDKPVTFKNAAQVRKSFEEKKYQAIAQGAEGLLAGSTLKGSEHSEVKHLYAQSLFALGKYRDAALEFNQLLVVPGMEAHLPEIKLRLGDCFRSLGDEKAALIFYRELLRDFPQSKEAENARGYVDKLGG